MGRGRRLVDAFLGAPDYPPEPADTGDREHRRPSAADPGDRRDLRHGRRAAHRLPPGLPAPRGHLQPGSGRAQDRHAAAVRPRRAGAAGDRPVPVPRPPPAVRAADRRLAGRPDPGRDRHGRDAAARRLGRPSAGLRRVLRGEHEERPGRRHHRTCSTCSAPSSSSAASSCSPSSARSGRSGVLLAAVPFTFAHLGKPELETVSTLLGGTIFGWLDWRTGSILYSATAHAIILTVVDVRVGRLGLRRRWPARPSSSRSGTTTTVRTRSGRPSGSSGSARTGAAAVPAVPAGAGEPRRDGGVVAPVGAAARLRPLPRAPGSPAPRRLPRDRAGRGGGVGRRGRALPTRRVPGPLRRQGSTSATWPSSSAWPPAREPTVGAWRARWPTRQPSPPAGRPGHGPGAMRARRTRSSASPTIEPAGERPFYLRLERRVEPGRRRSDLLDRVLGLRRDASLVLELKLPEPVT